MTKFQSSVIQMLKKIPKGRVTTYAAIAKAMGKPQAARAVGNALNKNTNLITIPCHRVVCSDGTIGGYAAGVTAKKRTLEQEGVACSANKIINFKQKYIEV